MKRRRSKILIGTATAASVTAVAILAAQRFGAAACTNRILTAVVSPDGRYKAVVFERDCGATTDYSTQVSVLAASDELGRDGSNIFVADTAGGKAPSGPRGGPQVRRAWKADEELFVGHHSAARIFRKEDRYRGVVVLYGVFE